MFMALALILSALNAQVSRRQTSQVKTTEQNQKLEKFQSSVQKPTFSQTAKLNSSKNSAPQFTPTNDGVAYVTLEAYNVWGDWSGYQLLLDPTATAYGTVIPAGNNLILYPNCNVPANLYDIFTYKIPNGATPDCNSPYAVVYGSATIPIPAGTYDFCIVNPTPNDRIWIAWDGRYDNYVFEAGKTYTFLLEFLYDPDTQSSFDNVVITVEDNDSNIPAPVSNVAAVPVGAAQTKISWTNPSLNIIGATLPSLSSVDVYVNDETTPVYTKSNPVVGGTDSYTYTFPSSGVYKFTVVASNANGSSFPQGVTVKNCTSVTLPLIQNFDDYSIGCWTMISNNYPNGPNGTNDNMGIVSIDGQNVFIFSSYYWAYDFNQYLITPELPSGSAMKITFDYARGNYMDENFIVGYSTTTNDISAFTWIGEYTTATNSFKNYFALVPAGTKYIAINYDCFNSYGGYYLYIKNIIIEAAKNNDAAIFAITAPVTSPNLTSTEMVTAVIRNEGLNPVTSLNLELTVDNGTPIIETYTGNIASGNTASYTFAHTANLSAFGNHTISVKAILTGDQNTNNDVKTIIVKHINCNVADFPWFDNCELTTEHALCWQFLGGDNGEGYSGEVATWYRASWGDEWGNMFISDSQYEQMAMPGMYNYIPLNPDNWLITPRFILNDNYTLSFKAGGGSGFSIMNERYSVLVSTTGTNFSDFTEIYRDTIKSYDMETKTIPLNQYNGQSIYIAFRHWNSKGIFLKLDDFEVSKSLDYDAAITAITAPVSGHHLTANQTVTATIKNFGVTPITSLDLELTVDGGTPITEHFTGNIASWSTGNYTFNAKANLSADGNHTISVKAILTGDQNSDNDETSITVRNVTCSTINTFPWTESFETPSSLDCWLQTYTSGTPETIDWTIVTKEEAEDLWVFSNNPAPKGLAMASFFDIGYVRYQTKLITPTLNISALSRPGVKFYYVNPSSRGNYDGSIMNNDTLSVYYKTSDAANWVQLRKFSHPFSEWEEVIIPLPNASNEYYIAFEGKNGPGSPLTLDDVSVYNLPLFDAAPINIAVPSSVINNIETPNPEHLYGVALTENETIITTVKNYGLNPINSLILELTVDGNVIATETYTNTIESFYTATYTFNAKADLSAAGNHTITVRTILTGDETVVNDSKSIIINNTHCGVTTLPLVQDFEDVSYMCWRFISNNEENNIGEVYGAGRTWSVSIDDENGNYLYTNWLFGLSSYNWADNGDYNQYLITPLLPQTNGNLTVSFDYASPYGSPEVFKVGYSTTTDDVAAFTWGGEILCYDWDLNQYTGTSPAGTKYIAINYYSNYMTFLIIDNIVIDGDVINSTPDVKDGNIVNIYQNNGEIFINVSEKSDIRVLDILGRVLGNYHVGANSTLNMRQPSGIYLLEVRSSSGGSTHKVVVK